MRDDAGGVGEYIRALKDSPRLGDFVVHHEVMAELPSVLARPARPWPSAIERLLADRGIEGLYAHHSQATDLVRSGRNVVVATPTASGKTLVYNLPVLEAALKDRDARALYLFPLKALAQDQLRALTELASGLPKELRPSCAVYDGDTSPYQRRKLRDDPPSVLLTNPEMTHLSLLPHHARWATFLSGLSHVVVDEVHTYRGVMGSHMAQVFRRLGRICRYYGSSPSYIFSSATIGNPGELARDLTGLPVEVVDRSGAPQGRRHVCFLNPPEGAATAAIQLLQAALARGLRTIVYTQSRKMTELISLWASEKSGEYKDRISAYRAGFLPEERRDIEARMTSGELLAVVSTSALELGIDIGGLDLCLLVGYPGTVMSTLQRGGRVGRGRQESAVVLIAQEDALDQYFMRNPRDFFERKPESAVVNPYNPVIMGRHLVCAASELTMRRGEELLREPALAARVEELVRSGGLLAGEDGTELFSPRKLPHRDIDLRGAGGSFVIEDTESGEAIGTVDEHRAYRETHPGAVYLHRGRTYRVEDLDIPGRTARAAQARVGYYTRARSNKTTEILHVSASRAAWGTRAHLGRLKVTEVITGYEKRQTSGGKLLGVVPLELPPLVFETDGLWFEIPDEVRQAAERRYMHFMGGIHAFEHAAIGILPLLVMADRNDFGGISTPWHDGVGSSAVFVYDGAAGGVGLSRQAFERAEELLASTLDAVRGCPCELGCPSCVHSPKCGSGNRPIDKSSAIFVLEGMRELPTPVVTPPSSAPEPWGRTVEAQELLEVAPGRPGSRGSRPEPADRFVEGPVKRPMEGPVEAAMETPDKALEEQKLPRYAVLDIETQRSAAEVGGWGRADRMGVSVAVLYDSATDECREYLEADVAALVAALPTFELVVGFNIKRFDYQVLRGYGRLNSKNIRTLDLLEEISSRLGYRLSLDALAQATLGAAKSASGLQALAWWKEGRVAEIAEYCKKDVLLTRDLYLYGRLHKYLLFTNKAGKKVRVPVDW